MYKLNAGYIALCIPNTYREFATKWLRLVESFHYLMCSLNNDSFKYGTFLHLPQPFYDFRLARHLHKNPFIYIEVSWVSGFLRGIFILYIYFYDSCASCVYGFFFGRLSVAFCRSNDEQDLLAKKHGKWLCTYFKNTFCVPFFTN